jgi:hypothetical protein
MGQTVHHKSIYHLQRADMLKASADGSIVITLKTGLTIILYSHKASEAGSIVCTNAAEVVRAMIQPGPQPAQLSGQPQNSLSGQKNTLQACSIVATIPRG